MRRVLITDIQGGREILKLSNLDITQQLRRIKIKHQIDRETATKLNIFVIMFF